MKQSLRKGDQVPFTQIANAVLNDPTLSLKAKGLWAYLYSKPEDWNFNADRITEESTDGRDAIQSTLRELEWSGYLNRLKLPDGRMHYVIKFVKDFSEPKPENPSLALDPKPDNPKVGKSQSGEIPRISNKEGGSNKEKKVTQTGRVAFEEFWKPYPKKVEKKKAEAKWNRLSPENQLSAALDVPKRAQTHAWKKDNGRYVPHPTTYLNGERWNDALDDYQEKKKTLHII